MVPHPKGTRARILLSSVFKPFAQDDAFGSRTINPVELYHNQVTREQGPFSLRMFHRTWGLMFLQQNISAPCTVLDFPTRARFIRELTSHDYDIVGLTGIIVNIGKVREMCRLVRVHSPRSVIVVGGHVTAIPGIERTIDADHIVKGEGVAWLREFLGEDTARPIEHPVIPSAFGFRLMGLRLPSGGGNAAATMNQVYRTTETNQRQTTSDHCAAAQQATRGETATDLAALDSRHEESQPNPLPESGATSERPLGRVRDR